MSSSISFNQMPASIRVPGTYVEIDNSRALTGLSEWPAKVLILGQRLTTGSVAALVPVRVTSPEQGRLYFGRGSQLAHMIEAWFRASPWVDVWAMAMDDVGAGVAATKTVTVTGPATATGEIALLIGGRRVPVTVTSGQAATAIATAIAAAVNASSDLMFTAAAASAVVTLTCRHKGEAGNLVDVRHSYYAGEALPSGVGLAIAAGVSGTTNPTVTTALDAVASTWFTDFLIPWTDATNVAAIEAQMLTAWGPVSMRDSMTWAALGGTHGALTTFGAARNNQLDTFTGLRGIPTPPWEWACSEAGMIIPALALDPARPVQTLQIPGVLAPIVTDRFTWQERNLLLRDGISTFTVNDAGQCFVERKITTYQTAPSGVGDVSFLDVETVKTLAYLRYDLRTFIPTRFPRFKLADDGTAFARGQDVATPGTIKAEIIARAYKWEAAGLVEGMDQFKADLIVVRNDTDKSRVDVRLPINIMNQLRVLAAQIQFIL